ncbi:MAG: c-type cytochrome [Geminicoccaceae bacterium]|nr:c-type cytochrome [Geminicoccaceae bacterium]
MKRLIALSLGLIAAGSAWAATSYDERARILAPTGDFTAAERFEDLPGGSATNRRRLDREAYSQPSANMPFADRGDFFVGNGFFKRLWVTPPSSTEAADGLGPLYNARACQRCHLKDGRGHPPAADEEAVSMFLRLSVSPASGAEAQAMREKGDKVVPEPTYGGQLQNFAVPGHAREGRMTIDYAPFEVEFADGTVQSMRRPTYGIADLGYGPMREDVMLSPRVASAMIGLGLLEAIAGEDIRAKADPEDADGDGVSGRAQEVWSHALGRKALGRFGWKAGNATIADQSSEALDGDIGVSNPLVPFPWGDCTERQPDCLEAPHGSSPQHEDLEASSEVMDLLIYYSQNLAVPARRDIDDPDVLAGKELFYNAGCIACHTPKHATRTDWPDANLRGQLIWPYTDLLLHDMGEGLADDRPEALADGREWRTPPLWGIGLLETVNGHTYLLHDGRARSFEEAILWHGGEAESAKETFRYMRAGERSALVRFLESL